MHWLASRRLTVSALNYEWKYHIASQHARRLFPKRPATVGRWHDVNGSASERTILVVEDDPTMVDILHILLADSGCRILSANRGRDAIEIVQAERPEVVTLDLGLPDMDGREVLRQLHPDPAWSGPSVIVVTARHFEPSPFDRVTAVLLKPFDAAELERVVLGALASAEPGHRAGLV